MYLYSPNQQFFNNQIPAYKDGSDMSNNYYNIGGYGYNNLNGYYNGVYTRHYNPYIEMQRQKEAEEAAKREITNQENINKFLNMQKYAYRNGYVPTEEELLNIDKVQYGWKYDNEDIDTINNTMFLEQACTTSVQLGEDYETYRMSGNLINVINRNNKADSLFDYFGVISENLVKEQDKINVSFHSNLNGMFNGNDYRSLLYSSSTGTNPMYNTNGDISDMSVALPAHLRNSYNDRRQKFLECILRSESNG